MSKENSPRFDVAARLGAKKPLVSSPPASPDDILFRSAVPRQGADQEATLGAEDDEALLRFGSQLPASTLIGLHRIAYWQRVPLYEVLTEALKMYGQTQPEADKPLPAKEWRARKLPRG